MVKKVSNKNKINKLWFVIIVLTVTQALMMLYIIRLDKISHDINKKAFDNLLVRVEEKRYKDPVIDIKENRVYIPEARIYLPFNETSRDIKYNFQTLSKSDKRLILSTRQVVGAQPSDSTALCDQIVTLSNELQDSKKITEIGPTMKDGLKYVTTLDLDCSKLYSNETVNEIIYTAKQAVSY